MLKKIVLACWAIVASFAGFAQGLIPSSIITGLNSFKDGYVLIAPFGGCDIVFQGDVILTEDAEAVFTYGEEVVATAKNLEVDENYQNHLYVEFDDVVLPKGKDYTFVLKANSVALASDPTIMNDEIKVSVVVPMELSQFIRNVTPKYADDGSKRYVGMSMDISASVVAVGEPKWNLVRNGEVMAQYAAEISASGTIGKSTCMVRFPALTMDEGADYALVLPKDSFAAAYRSDITNDEYSIVLQRGEGSGSQGLVPNSITAGMMGVGSPYFEDGYVMLTPWTGCGMEFADKIVINEGAEAVVTCGGEVVATASGLELAEPEDWYTGNADMLYIDFPEVNLPKGEEYVFTLKANSVALKSDPTQTNEDISVRFTVPASIDYVSKVTPKYVSTTDKRYVGLELTIAAAVVAVGEPQWILKRNGEVIGRYAATVDYHDFNLSSCTVDFPAITFDEGAEYTLTLPEGSYAAMYRPDITNVERVEYLQKGESGIDEVAVGVDEASETVYDLQGRRVVNPGKGFYIINGKKVIKRQ